MKYLNRPLIGIFLGLFSAFSSCVKTTDESKPGFAISVDNPNPLPFDYIKIKVIGQELTLNEYSAAIGDINISAIKYAQDTLIAMIPDLPANSYKLTLIIGSKTGSLDIKIKEPPVIQNQTEILDKLVMDVINSISGLEKSFAETGDSLEYEDKLLLSNLINAFNETYSNLSDNEKSGFSRYIAGNPGVFEPFGIGVKKSAVSDKLLEYKNYYVDQIPKIGLASFSFYLSFSSPDLLSKAITLGSAVFLVTKIKEIGRKTIGLYNEAVSVTGSEISNSKKISDFVFENDKPIILDISAKYRTIYSADLSTNNAVLFNIFENLDRFQSIWTNFDASISKLKSVFGFQGGALTGMPSKLADISEYKEIDYSGNSGNSDIINISNSNVNVQITKIDSQLKLVFTTNSVSEQSFSFTYQYSEDGITTEKVYTAILLVQHPFSISKVSGDNQDGSFGLQLKEPIKVLVLDENNKPYKNAKVFFVPRNAGAFSQSQVYTSADGIASVSWTLGNVDTVQYLDVTAYKNDNISMLFGSPMTFVAHGIDSLALYKKSCLGWWTVIGHDPVNPSTTYTLELFSDGTGTYHIPDNPKTYQTNWDVKKSNSEYRFFEKGFWNVGYDNAPRDKLSYPVTGFKTYGIFDVNFVSQEYIKN